MGHDQKLGAKRCGIAANQIDCGARFYIAGEKSAARRVAHAQHA
jgi:hypothetical protein